MTLEEAIKHCEEKTKELKNDAELFKRVKATEKKIADCEECAKEHEQLAEWLKELRRYRECGCVKDECFNCGGCDNGRGKEE